MLPSCLWPITSAGAMSPDTPTRVPCCYPRTPVVKRSLRALAGLLLIAPATRPELSEGAHRAIERKAGCVTAERLIGPVRLPVTP